MSRSVAGGLAAEGADTTDGGGFKISTLQVVGLSLCISVTTGGGLSAGDVGEVGQTCQTGVGGNVDAACLKAGAVVEVSLSI